MLIDLQLHSTYSDGYLTPTQIARFLKNEGIKIASLTDHNTIRGQNEFFQACQKLDIKAIPGLELYASHNNTHFNILWYNYKDDSQLHDLLRESQVKRKNKARKILELFKDKGFKIDNDKILDQFNHYVPINRLIDSILKESANKQIIYRGLKNTKPREEEIIKKFFFNKSGFLHESYLNILRIIKLRKKIGGQIILNHPGKYKRIKKDFLIKLKRIGIDGVEVISPHHSIGAIFFLQFLSRDLKLIETGGSDFHRFEGNGYPIQHAWQYFKIKSRYLKNIDKIIG